MIPSTVIFERERLNHDLTKGEVLGTLYGVSENGWIDRELFFSLAKQPFCQAHITNTTSLTALLIPQKMLVMLLPNFSLTLFSPKLGGT